MNVLIINSSARINGNTDKILSYMKSSLEKQAIDVEYVFLSKQKIETCMGCRLCFDIGEKFCPRKDDLLSIYGKIMSSNLMIIGGPIYVEDVNGIIKNMIDRLAFVCHRPSFYNQKSYVILSSGSGASSHAIKTIARALQAWGTKIIGKRKITLGAKINDNDFQEKISSIIDKDIEKIIAQIGKYNNPSFLQIMTFQIQKWYYSNKANKGSFDYNYWKEKGWLTEEFKYYSGEKIGFLKILGARILGYMIRKLILK